MEYKIIRHSDDYLMHYGVLGMKWGVRRYQNPDGTLTEAGKRRYFTIDKNGNKILTKKGLKYNRSSNEAISYYRNVAEYNLNRANKKYKKELDLYKKLNSEAKNKYRNNINNLLNKGVSLSVAKELLYDPNANKSLEASERRLKKMIEEAVYSHPAVGKLKISILSTDDNSVHNIDAGKAIVNSILFDIKR